MEDGAYRGLQLRLCQRDLAAPFRGSRRPQRRDIALFLHLGRPLRRRGKSHPNEGPRCREGKARTGFQNDKVPVVKRTIRAEAPIRPLNRNRSDRQTAANGPSWQKGY